MPILPGLRLTLSRYLTLIYGFTLGLALLLAILAIGNRKSTSPDLVTPAPPVFSPSNTPTPHRTRVQPVSTPTPLPLIPPTPNEETPSALGVTSEELSGLQVSLWHPWTGTTGEALEGLVEEFNRTNRWRINVQTSGFEGFGNLDEALEIALTSQTHPDVIVNYGYRARDKETYDVLVDLNPYTNDPVWGLSSEVQADFYPAFWGEDVVTEGSQGQTKRLGIPYYRSAYVMFYNQSWGRELGYPNPPVTPEDFRLRACAAAETVPEQGDPAISNKGGWLITPQPGALIGWIYSFGGVITDPEGTGYLFNTSEAQQALEYLKNLQTNGCAWYEPEADPLAEFAGRQALFIVGSLLDIPAQQEAMVNAGNQDEWVALPYPSDGDSVVVGYGPSLMITRSTPPQQLAAWLVVEWLVYPPNQAEWVKTLGTYPTREIVLIYLHDAAKFSSHWAQALELIPIARSEPSTRSWGIMRWALQDAMKSLFNPQFEIDQIPALLENLDALAVEIDSQVR